MAASGCGSSAAAGSTAGSGSNGSGSSGTGSGGTGSGGTGSGGTGTGTGSGSGSGGSGSTVAAPTVAVTATPTSIVVGSSSILNVTATNATSVTIAGTDKSSYTLATTGGSQAVSPTATTSYTVTATGSGGSATASVTVTVTANPAPTVSLTANPPQIADGSTSTLQVATSYATAVTITGTDGSSYTLQGTNTSQTVSPTATTTYTATATGAGGSATATATVTVTPNPAPTVTIAASPTTITAGHTSTLTVTAANATAVTVTGSDSSSYTLQPTGGTQAVTPTATTVYTATATGAAGTTPATTQVTVTVSTASLNSIDHVIFMLQENHTFDNYFGMLNPYRNAQKWTTDENGVTTSVDGIDDKMSAYTSVAGAQPAISNPDDSGTNHPLFALTSTCIDDDSSAWLASFGDVNRYDFSTTRPIQMNGFVHTAAGYDNSCANSGSCSGTYTDSTGVRAMGYYDQNTLNYYYYMAAQFAISDRWFSPVASESIDNRIATFTGGTTGGVTMDPDINDHIGQQLTLPTIFQELDNAKSPVSWKIYYTVTQGFCQVESDDCNQGGTESYPATDFSSLSYSYKYLYENPTHAACQAPTISSNNPITNDSSGSFCVDPTHIAPITQYYTDLQNGTLPAFTFIEAGYANNDEHPGSGQSILMGQAEVAKVVNSFMTSSSWADSVFFFSYDEGGGPYDHVPPVPNHTNDFTDASVASQYPTDIKTISVAPDGYAPCDSTSTTGATPNGTNGWCDLQSGMPGYVSTDAPSSANQGFAAQLGFRLPNIVISPFSREHYVSHIPMDHTAVIKFVENRFLGPNASLTARDAAQPNLLDFFDFTKVPWATPPTPPVASTTNAGSTCNPQDMP